MNEKNPLFTSCDHKEDCTCDNVFNELTPIKEVSPEQLDRDLKEMADLLPINPAQARQKLDCLTRYREALEYIAKSGCCQSPGCSVEDPMCVAMTAQQALKEESEQ